MNLFMTFNAFTNNEQRLRIVGMMVFLCLFATGAFEAIRAWQSTGPYGSSNRIRGFSFFRVFSFAIKASAITCNFASIALEVGFAAFALSVNSQVSFLVSLTFFGLTVGFFSSLAFIALFVSLLASPAIFALLIGCLTTLALRMQPVFGRTVFAEFRDFFNFLAFRASFCFNYLRHGFFLIKKLCSEPLQTQYLCGSLYYSSSFGGVK